MRQIILHTAKALARDKTRPGELLFTDAGTVLSVPSEGLTAEMAKAWVADGTAADHAPAQAEKPAS